MILGSPCLFMIDIGTQTGPPEGLSKHIARVRTKWNGLTLYITNALSTRQRRRLIARHIPFVVPGYQLFLPPLGIDLREHFVRQQQPPTYLDPSAQVLVLSAALGGVDELSLAEAVAMYGYAKMTMSRAFDAIEQLGLGIRKKRNKARIIAFVSTGTQLWQLATPYLRDPVARKVIVEKLPATASTRIAGQSALANLTSLAPPRRSVVAMSSVAWSALCKDNRIIVVDEPYTEHVDIEIWRYPAEKISTSRLVDPLSLLLSLKSSSDARVQIALDELEAQLQW